MPATIQLTRKTANMTTLFPSAKYPAPWRRGVARVIATVTGAFETAFEVIDEATDQSAAARRAARVSCRRRVAEPRRSASARPSRGE